MIFDDDRYHEIESLFYNEPNNLGVRDLMAIIIEIKDCLELEILFKLNDRNEYEFKVEKKGGE